MPESPDYFRLLTCCGLQADLLADCSLPIRYAPTSPWLAGDLMQFERMKRRQFITLLGGAAAWPVAARAQQGGRVRRIGVLMSFDENDPAMKRRVSAFTQALADLGWTDGRNVRMDLRGRR